jgi:N-acetyl-anhydromuramyl-L-alanine amidase AmpD
LSSTSLYYDATNVVDIGVRVVRFDEPGAPSFYNHRRADNTPMFNRPAEDRRPQVKQVVLHHDGMSNSAGCFSVLRQRGLSTHLMIDHDGVVYQPLALYDIAWHAGDQVNRQSIGIDVNNPVLVNRRGNQKREVFQGKIHGTNKFALGYTDAQYDALIAVLGGLFQIFPSIKRQAPLDPDGKVVQRRLAEPAGFSGIVGHLHVSANKWDPGPGFEWERILVGIRGSRFFFPVTLPGRPNLSTVLRHQALDLAEQYFVHNEQATKATGTYPVGMNQAWHTGVHLKVPAGTPILAPFEGSIRVARNFPLRGEHEKVGSPNLVVVRHRMKVGDQDRTFFTVVTHVASEDTSPNSRVPWLKRFATDQRFQQALDSTSATNAAPGYNALRAERVALLDIPVKAGELIGHTARFAPDRDGPAEDMVDVAVVAPMPLFGRTDPRFEAVSDDTDARLLCTSRAVWKRFTDDPEALRGLVEGTWPLDPSEIREFFRDARRARQMRWLACQHPTEWSDKTDLSFLFGPRLEFEWRARLEAEKWERRLRPYLWWDEEVNTHLEFGRERLVWSYHPIALFTELAVGAARQATTLEGDAVRTVSDEEYDRVRQNDAQTEFSYAVAAGQDASAIDPHGQQGSGSRQEVEGRVRDLEKEFEEAAGRETWLRWEQGEWEED